MVKDILRGAGFTENVDFKETRFLKPPNTTYAVYMDSYTRRGADAVNLVKEHTYTIELYSYKVDPISENLIEAEFDLRGIEYDKEDRYWINDEGLYQTIYTFDWIEK